MDTAPSRIESDYTDRIAARGHRLRLLVIALGVLGFFALYPFDGPISAFFARCAPRGDLRRELETLQQFGALSSVLIASFIIWRLDRTRRALLLDWYAASLAGAVVYNVLKHTIGRPRPKFDDPAFFTGPFGVYPLDGRLRHPWEFWNGISSDLASMPSSHTFAAVIMAVALTWMYPRLRPLAVVMVLVVGVARVALRAHYPTDVIVGFVLAYCLATIAFEQAWGRRLAAHITGRRDLLHAGSIVTAVP